MADVTRRRVLRDGSLAVGAAVIGGGSAMAATGSVFHIFGFQWNSGVTDEQKARAKKDILAFQGKIPGLVQTHVGENISPRGKGYTFGGVMEFTSREKLDAYVVHPQHQALLAWLKPLIDAVELDLMA